jgi:hypothetical protein
MDMEQAHRKEKDQLKIQTKRLEQAWHDQKEATDSAVSQLVQFRDRCAQLEHQKRIDFSSQVNQARTPLPRSSRNDSSASFSHLSPHHKAQRQGRLPLSSRDGEDDAAKKRPDLSAQGLTRRDVSPPEPPAGEPQAGEP